MAAVFAMVRFPSLCLILLKNIRAAARKVKAAFVIDPVVGRISHCPSERLHSHSLAIGHAFLGGHLLTRCSSAARARRTSGGVIDRSGPSIISRRPAPSCASRNSPILANGSSADRSLAISALKDA